MKDHVFWRDELLQLMFWMAGEKMGEVQNAKALARFLAADESGIEGHLAQMAADGFLHYTELGYQLTDGGRAEGARRFREEFEPMVGQGHGECNDPECDCQELGPEHCKSQIS